ncbi:unnamed protein product [Ectocarpus sp. 13 AM-2016]
MEQPFLSVSGTETVFSLQTWRDWVRTVSIWHSTSAHCVRREQAGETLFPPFAVGFYRTYIFQTFSPNEHIPVSSYRVPRRVMSILLLRRSTSFFSPLRAMSLFSPSLGFVAWLEGDTEGGDNADDDGQENGAGGGNANAGGGKQKAKNREQRIFASYLAFFIVDWLVEPVRKVHGLPPRTEIFRGLIAAVRGRGCTTKMDEALGGIVFRTSNFLDKERIEILRNTAGAGAKAGAKAAGAAPGNDDDQDEGAETSRTSRSRSRTPPRAGKAARSKQLASANVPREGPDVST